MSQITKITIFRKLIFIPATNAINTGNTQAAHL